MFISDILGMPDDDFIMKEWKGRVSDYPEFADEISEDFLIKEIRPSYNKLREARNTLAHGNGAISYSELRKRIPIIIDCIDYVNAGYKQYPSTKYILENVLCS